MSKPKEFYIPLMDAPEYTYRPEFGAFFHVIEYSAYEDMYGAVDVELAYRLEIEAKLDKLSKHLQWLEADHMLPDYMWEETSQLMESMGIPSTYLYAEKDEK